MVHPWRVAVAGVGNVGKALLALVAERGEELSRLGLGLRVVGLATRRHGPRWAENGWEAGALAAAFPDDTSSRSTSLEAWLDDCHPQILVDLLPQSDDGEPSRTLIAQALLRGIHVVTANKAPLALAGAELTELARVHDRSLLHTATVLDAVPLRAMLQAMPLARFHGLRAVVNSTSGVVLDALTSGRTLQEGVAEAQRMGIAEADPQRDLDGRDAAMKLVLLTRLVLGEWVPLGEVARQGVADLTAEQRRHGARVRLVAEAWLRDGRVVASVAPREVGPEDPLGFLRGPGEAVELVGDAPGRLLTGMPAPTVRDTAAGVLHDVVEVAARGIPGVSAPRPRV
ncbi:MAG: hypothetical protein AB2A00_42280 [Myxococcota bacterium]